MKKATQQDESLASFEALTELSQLLWSPDPRKKAVKKKPAKKEAWHSAFWVDSEFQYKNKEVLALWPILPSPLRTFEMVQRLEELVREILSEDQHNKRKPGPSQITAHLQELETRLSLLLKTLTGLHSPTLSLLELTAPIQSVRQNIQELEDRLRSLRSRVGWVAYQHGTPKGAPRQQARRNLIDTLCEFWTHQTGKQPTCWNDPKGGYSGPFYHFAYASIAPAFGETGLSEAIADVVKARRNKGKKSAKK